ncbi:MAG: hypothetical protein DMG65_20870 [Candidatus Angelobacter sp. Gp1-AA117]|nr:MAG: hypothetical protein DMG65_20870 [Candidatus Angelobacter sp. Gp1-AA117]
MVGMLSSAVKAIKAQGQNRLTHALFSGFKAMLWSFGRTFYVLWLEMTGFVFAAFTFISASALVKQIRIHGWVHDKQHFWAAVGFTTVCLWLTVTSFTRAKKTSKK